MPIAIKKAGAPKRKENCHFEQEQEEEHEYTKMRVGRWRVCYFLKVDILLFILI